MNALKHDSQHPNHGPNDPGHETILQWLSRDLDRELGPKEQILLTDHLDGCPRCAKVALQWRATRRAIAADARVRVPVGLVDRIMARTASEAGFAASNPGDPVRGRVLPLLPWLKRSAAVAAALLALIGIGYVSQMPREAYADTKPSAAPRDPALEQALQRWEEGRRREAAFFELLLPAPRKSR